MAKQQIEESEDIRHIELNSPEGQELLKKYPPPECGACGGITGIYGTPGLMAYLGASGVKIVCSKPCEKVVLTELAMQGEDVDFPEYDEDEDESVEPEKPVHVCPPDPSQG